MSTEILRLSEFSDSTPVLIPTVERPIEMSVLDVIRWVAPTAPPGEALKFLLACQMAQVNPFLGEAHLVDHGGKFTTIIDKSGYLKRAQAHPAYEGHEAGIIAQTIDKTTDTRGPLVELSGAFLPHGMIVVGGWAKVHRKGIKRPIEIRVSVQEYNRQQGTWKTLTCTMIRKVALVQALRESGLISTGWYAEGEIAEATTTRATFDSPDPDVMLGKVALGRAIEAEYDHAEDSAADPDLLARVIELVNDSGMTSAQLQSALHKRGVSRLAELSNLQLNELVVRLSAEVRYSDPLKGMMPGLMIEVEAEELATPAAAGSNDNGNDSDNDRANADADAATKIESISNEA